MGQDNGVPFDGCYHIDDQLMAGPYPGARAVPDMSHRLDALLNEGVDSFVDLTVAEEGLQFGNPLSPYDLHLFEIAGRRDAAVEYQRFPIQDMDIPGEAEMKDILDAIDEARGRGKYVYVHCLGGVGRTGTVIGCWLARHGIAVGRQALHAIDSLRRYEPGNGMRSPQTRKQCEMVKHWEPGQ